MKTTHVRFEQRKVLFNGHSPWVAPRGTRLCNTTTRRAVGIPKDTHVIYIVFSDKHSADDFTITRRFPEGNNYPIYGVDVNYRLMFGARFLLERMYKRGYRYVRIEYDA